MYLIKCPFLLCRSPQRIWAVLKVIVVHRLNKLIFKLKQEDQHVISLLLFIYTQFLKCINSVTVSQCLYISNHKPFKSGKNHCKNQHIFKKKKKKLRAAFQAERGGQILQLITNPACGPVRVFILWVNMQRLQRLKCSVKEKGGVQRKHSVLLC